MASQDLALFDSLLEVLEIQTPEKWKKTRDTTSERKMKKLRSTGLRTSLLQYQTAVKDPENQRDTTIVLERKTKTIMDQIPDGEYFPHPFSDPVVSYCMKVVSSGIVAKKFEGERIYDSFIQSSLEMLEEYHQHKVESTLN